MAETSPLINLDLVNQIYKVINAQIAERVYNPQYYTSATLGTSTYPYVSACISGNTSTGRLNELTLTKASAGFTISGGTTSKTLTVGDTVTITKPLEVTAATNIKSSLTVSAATNIIKSLTVGAAATYTGAVTIRSGGTGSTTIVGPDGKTANLINGNYTTSATTSNSDTPTAGSLLKIGTVDAKKFLAGPTSGSGTADYRTIAASDLPEELTCSNAATASQVKTIMTSADAKHYISFVNSNNKDALAEGVFTSSALTYNPSTGTLGATKLVGELGAGNITGTLGVGHGGTGIASFAAGDILYASDTSTLAALNKGTDGQVLKLSGGKPAWGTDNTPTAFAWANGTTAGPTGSLTGNGMSAVNFAAIPSASGSASGIVTTEPQTFAGAKTFADTTDSTNNTSGAVTVSGGLGVAKNIYAAAVHNAVWNDLVDCMEVPEDTSLEFGYCYSWKGDSVIKSSRSSKNCIGIHSNTAGFVMGEKKTKTIQVAVAGFVLAYVDRLYPEGTPLTWGDNGTLTKCSLLKRVLHPERIIATFYKEEKEEKWHNLPVSGRHWVKTV